MSTRAFKPSIINETDVLNRMMNLVGNMENSCQMNGHVMTRTICRIRPLWIHANPRLIRVRRSAVIDCPGVSLITRSVSTKWTIKFVPCQPTPGSRVGYETFNRIRIRDKHPTCHSIRQNRSSGNFFQPLRLSITETPARTGRTIRVAPASASLPRTAGRRRPAAPSAASGYASASRPASPR